MDWHALSKILNGLQPAPRELPGLTSLNGKLFVLGGHDEAGDTAHHTGSIFHF